MYVLALAGARIYVYRHQKSRIVVEPLKPERNNILGKILKKV